MTRRFIEALAILVAFLIGYGGVTAAQQIETVSAVPSPTRQSSRPTPTVAPAVTFTPAPSSTPAPPATPTTSPTATPTIPSTPAVTSTATATPTTAEVVYKVQAGDTVYSIARKFGVAVTSLVQANHLSDPNKLSLGQKLIIPRK